MDHDGFVWFWSELNRVFECTVAFLKMFYNFQYGIYYIVVGKRIHDQDHYNIYPEKYHNGQSQ